MSPRTYEEEPPVSEYRRSSYVESSRDHELTLGTPTILGLFFALALVCACFFGLGYAMGHRTAPATPQVFDNSTATASGAAKPTAGSAAPPDTQPAADTTTASPEASAASGTQTATVPLNSTTASATPSPAPATAFAASTAKPVAVATPTSTAAAPGSFMVQVAAVSSQDVANILLSTLQKKGYAVAVHHEPQDQLLHVQIGPFSERKDAEAMRQRVITDGFNAIVK
jgi:cell division septation protein DedD